MYHGKSDILILLSISISICAIGTMTNMASLIYFIKKGEKSLGDKLLLTLNRVDLLLCITAAIVSSSMLLAPLYLTDLLVAYLCVVDGTSYATCLLSVTRAIGIASPFYKIRGKLLIAVGGTFFVVMELAASLVPNFCSHYDYVVKDIATARIAITLAIILAVLCATAVSVYKLTKKDITQEETEGTARSNKKATWTVVILSTLFIVFNSINIGTTAHLFIHGIYGMDYKSPWFRFGTLIAIPLNSAINPIVYIVRKSDMRAFFIQKLCCRPQ